MKITYLLDAEINASSMEELVTKLLEPAAPFNLTNFKTKANIRLLPLVQTLNGRTSVSLKLEICIPEDNSY